MGRFRRVIKRRQGIKEALTRRPRGYPVDDVRSSCTKGRSRVARRNWRFKIAARCVPGCREKAEPVRSSPYEGEGGAKSNGAKSWATVDAAAIFSAEEAAGRRSQPPVRSPRCSGPRRPPRAHAGRATFSMTSIGTSRRGQLSAESSRAVQEKVENLKIAKWQLRHDRFHPPEAYDNRGWIRRRPDSWTRAAPRRAVGRGPFAYDREEKVDSARSPHVDKKSRGIRAAHAQAL